MAEGKKKFNIKKILLSVLLIIVSMLGGAGIMFAIIKFTPLCSLAGQETTINNISTIEEKVTVTDEGIAAAVKKVYDAVVIVENYSNGREYATGTGFVYKVDGDTAYIMTNHHVIENNDEVKVVFTSGEEVSTKVVGSDSYADIAVLAVDASKIISVAEIGKSESAEIGDTVFAVGAPLDSVYSWTVTRGILSGKDRMVEVSTTNSNSSDWVMKVLQTDTAINSGNSGGPLANSNGEVIGVTSLKLVSNGVEGMGFAIPIEEAMEYAEIIESGKTVERPYLGVGMVDLTSAIYYGARVPEGVEQGVYLSEVDKDSPSSDAGLKVGDVIVKIDDTDITNVATLRYYLYKYNVGDSVKITYYRDSEVMTAKVKLAASK